MPALDAVHWTAKIFNTVLVCKLTDSLVNLLLGKAGCPADLTEAHGTMIRQSMEHLFLFVHFIFTSDIVCATKTGFNGQKIRNIFKISVGCRIQSFFVFNAERLKGHYMAAKGDFDGRY